jgi:anti-sigma B factor antagonist
MRADANGHATLAIEGPTARVSLRGEIDLANVAQVDACVTEALGAAGVGDIVIDLTQCTYLDSSGLRALVRSYANARRDDCELAIVGATGIVRRVIELTKLDAELPLRD